MPDKAAISAAFPRTLMHHFRPKKLPGLTGIREAGTIYSADYDEFYCHNLRKYFVFITIPQIIRKKYKETLGISGIETMEYAWRSRTSEPDAQIDLVIDRRDDVINICEMKYAANEFTIDTAYEKNLRHKLEAFRAETGTTKALRLTMITSSGLKRNEHAAVVQNEITAAELMRD